MRTWQVEMLVVACVLAVVAFCSGRGWLEFVGAGAVLLSFGHAQVADRLAENERERQAFAGMSDIQAHSVECHRWATRYLVSKEALWLVYFVLHHSWSALTGVALFIAYPAWRQFWRSQKPAAR